MNSASQYLQWGIKMFVENSYFDRQKLTEKKITQSINIPIFRKSEQKAILQTKGFSAHNKHISFLRIELANLGLFDRPKVGAKSHSFERGFVKLNGMIS